MTPREHQDRLQLQTALTELDTLTHRLNDTKRDSDDRLEAKRLLADIGGRTSLRVDHRDVHMVRSDDIVEVVGIPGLVVTLVQLLYSYEHTHTHAHLTAFVRVYPGEPVPER